MIGARVNQAARGKISAMGTLRSKTGLAWIFVLAGIFLLASHAYAAVPSAISDLTANSGDGQVDLGWSAPANGGSPITGYLVQYRPSGGSFVTATTTTATTTTVGGLTNGVLYEFDVQAINISGTAADSNTASTRPLTLVKNETFESYSLGSSIDGQGGWVVGSGAGWQVVSDNGSQGLKNTTSTSYTANSIRYSARVFESVRVAADFKAINATNFPQIWLGAPSASGSTQGYLLFGGVGTPATFTLAAQTSGLATLLEASTPINITADAYYTIEFELIPDASGHPVLRAYIYSMGGSRPATPFLSYTDTANQFTTGYVALGAHTTADGIFDNIRIYSINTPGAPTGLSAFAQTGAAALVWTAPLVAGTSSVSDYLVEYKPSVSSTWATFSDGVSTSTRATVTGLTNGTPYDFRVSAMNTAGTGLPSATATTTPMSVSIPNPQFLLRFDGNYDNSYGATNATEAGSGNEFVTDGTRGQVLSLNGSGYAAISADLATSTFTKAAWVNLTATGASYNIISNSSNNSHYFWVEGGHLATGDLAVGTKATEAATFPTNTWVYVAVTFNASNNTYKLYRDGLLVATGTTSAAPRASSATNIGSYGGGSSFVGYIDDAEMWSSALNDNQIYLNYTGVTATPTPPDAPTGLIANGGNAQATLLWSAPAEVGTSPISNYLIEYKPSASSTWNSFSHATSTATSIVVTGLTNNVAYDFRVSAVSADGTGSSSLPFSTTPSTAPTAYYYQILSTGQSLSTGASAAPALSTTQPYNNIMLSPGVEGTSTPAIPLIESGQGENNGVETISSGMANSLRAALTDNRPFAVALHGHDGAVYSSLAKGTSYYTRGLLQATTTKNYVENTLGGVYKPIGVTLIHGESDYAGGNAGNYESYLAQWQSDYQTDVNAITGATSTLPMFMSQMNVGTTGELAAAQLAAHRDYPDKIIMVGPKYQLDYVDDHLHLTNTSEKKLGELYAKVMKKVIFDHATWNPLMPTAVNRSGNVITVSYAIPTGTLAIDTTNVAERTNYGFEFAQTGGNSVSIASVALVNSSTQVQITLSATPTGTNQKLRYAYSCAADTTPLAIDCGGASDGTFVGGNIRDTDTSVSPSSAGTGTALYDWSVAFDEAVSADVTPPGISSVAATTTATTATITWSTDENASSQVDYGPTASYAASTTEADTSPRVTSHSVVLTSLVSCSMYHYRVHSSDASLNESTSTDASFFTAGCTGSAAVTTSTQATVATSTGGILSLSGSSSTITLAVPAGFAASAATFQIKQLATSSVILAAGSPSGAAVVGNFVYDLKALTGATTTLSSFTASPTITISYTAADVTGLDESGLAIYRYDGSSWIALTGCSVDTSAKTVTCTTPGFSVFGIFWTSPASSNSNSSSGTVIVSGGGGSGGGLPATSYIFPQAPSSDPRLLINAGAKETATSIVRLTLDAGKDVTRVAISNNPIFQGSSVVIAYAPSLFWDLCIGRNPCQGPLTVYAKFYTASGQASETVAASIFFSSQIKSNPAPLGITKNIGIGSIGPEVRLLQKFLNAQGFTVSLNGPGSPGQETTLFGFKTRLAVIRFQEAYADEILLPVGLTSGTGTVGPSTRAMIGRIRGE